MKTSIFNLYIFKLKYCFVWNSYTNIIKKISYLEYVLLKTRLYKLLNKDRRIEFIEYGFLVGMDNERQNFLEEQKYWIQHRLPHFRILTTTACNAKCKYCYEKNTKISTMNFSTADKLAEFILQRNKNHPVTGKIHLEWFGGEPTLNTKVIDIICKKLDSANIEFYSSMMSNGIFEAENVLGNIKNWRLKSVQITLDGHNLGYEKIKNVPPGTFSKVLKNIDFFLLHGVNVTIRINLDDNFSHIVELIYILANKYAKKQIKPKIYIASLYSSTQAIPLKKIKKILKLNDLLIVTGLMEFNEIYNFFKRGKCFAATQTGFTITPEGKLVNCSHNLSDDIFAGTIWDFDEAYYIARRFLSESLDKKCMNCIYLPICAGGCSAARHRLAEINQCFPYKLVMKKILLKRMHGL